MYCPKQSVSVGRENYFSKLLIKLPQNCAYDCDYNGGYVEPPLLGIGGHRWDRRPLVRSSVFETTTRCNLRTKISVHSETVGFLQNREPQKCVRVRGEPTAVVTHFNDILQFQATKCNEQQLIKYSLALHKKARPHLKCTCETTAASAVRDCFARRLGSRFTVLTRACGWRSPSDILLD